MAGQPATWGSRASVDVMTGRAAPIALPRDTFLALLTQTPNDNTTLASMVEVTTTGYARQKVTWTAPTIPVDSPYWTSTNSALITFGPFTAEMASASTYVALVSAASGTVGDFIFYWSNDPPPFARINEAIQLPAGQLVLSHN